MDDPMTATEEETDLARVIYDADPEWGGYTMRSGDFEATHPYPWEQASSAARERAIKQARAALVWQASRRG